MIEFYKKRTETPLQALDRLRIETPELADETLSYAGRLDPMAEGILPILVGKEENAQRQEFLHKNKEYKAEFVLGFSTDTGDVLGIITDSIIKKVDTEKIKQVFENLTQIKTQTYPWYSSKTVNGKALFEYAREGRFDITRPEREIEIYSVKNIEYKEVDGIKLIEEIISDIKMVKGDFRQGEIIEGWKGICHPDALCRHPREGGDPGIKPLDSRLRGNDVLSECCEILLVSCILNVSSGTYIRGLCEILEKELDVPVVLHKLIRIRVY